MEQKAFSSLLYVHCSGSVTFWYGSGSADPYHGLTDPDHAPDSFSR